MQRRRQSSHQNPTYAFDPVSSDSDRLPTAATATAAAAAPSDIELRPRPHSRSRPPRQVHATSSSISGLYQRAPSSYSATSNTAAGSSYYEPPSLHVAPSPAAADTIFIMKPLVSAVQAWACVVISAFAILILSILGLLFKNNHHEMVGGIEDPENGPEVAATIFVAVLIYVGFLVFCGLQGMLHLRENRRGAIAL